jgi:hypothetical protein
MQMLKKLIVVGVVAVTATLGIAGIAYADTGTRYGALSVSSGDNATSDTGFSVRDQGPNGDGHEGPGHNENNNSDTGHNENNNSDAGHNENNNSAH